MLRALPQVSRRVFVLLFSAGLILQAGSLWLRGTSDVQTFQRWALSALSRGLPNAYTATSTIPGAEPAVLPDYPPISLYVLAGAVKLATFVDPSTVLGSRLLVAFVKGPTLLLRMTVVALIFFMVKRLTRDPGVARSVALAYWLNPALILNGPALGYLDPLCSIPGLFAIIAAANGWAASAGVLAAVSLLIKPQGLFFILPVAAVLWRARDFGFARAVLNGGVICVVTVLPFLLTAPVGLLAAAQVNLTEDFLSADAMNVWWIIGAVGMLAAHGWSALSGRLPTLTLTVFADHAGFNPRLLTTAFVIGVALWAFWQVRGRRDAGLAAAMCAFVFHVYFVFAVNVHENHLAYAIPLVGLTALTEKAYWRLYVGLSLFVSANLVIFYGLGRDFEGMERVRWFWPISLLGSGAGIALLWYHFRLFRSLIATHTHAPGRTVGFEHLPTT